MNLFRHLKKLVCCFLLVTLVGTMFVTLVACDSGNGIEIIEEELVTDARYAVIGYNLYPILVVKVKNISSATKNVSFEVNFYADGNLLGSGTASFVTLASGDETYMDAQSNKGYAAWTDHDYTYKITKWTVYF